MTYAAPQTYANAPQYDSQQAAYAMTCLQRRIWAATHAVCSESEYQALSDVFAEAADELESIIAEHGEESQGKKVVTTAPRYASFGFEYVYAFRMADLQDKYGALNAAESLTRYAEARESIRGGAGPRTRSGRLTSFQ